METILNSQRINDKHTFKSFSDQTGFVFKIHQKSPINFYWNASKNGLLTYSSYGSRLKGFSSFQFALEDLKSFIINHRAIF